LAAVTMTVKARPKAAMLPPAHPRAADQTTTRPLRLVNTAQVAPVTSTVARRAGRNRSPVPKRHIPKLLGPKRRAPKRLGLKHHALKRLHLMRLAPKRPVPRHRALRLLVPSLRVSRLLVSMRASRLRSLVSPKVRHRPALRTTAKNTQCGAQRHRAAAARGGAALVATSNRASFA